MSRIGFERILKSMNKIYNGHSKASGIYQIKNLINGKVYIGQAKQLATRAMQHERSLNSQKHDNKHLQAAWNFYGSDAFEFTVLQVVEGKAERDVAEQALITQFYGDGCYNIMKDVNPRSETWSHTPEETKAKMSKAKKGKPISPEALIKRRMNKRLHTPEAKAKIGQAHKGKIVSDETRAKMSAVHKEKIVSDETRAKMSAVHKGKIFSDETRAKLSAVQKGKIFSDETRAKMSEAKKGKARSEETKAKIRESHKKRWQNQRQDTVILIEKENR